jgi:glycosyltransferase involved in cell wall biosynthesis
MRGELVKNGFDAGKIDIIPPMPPEPPPSDIAPQDAPFTPGRLLFIGQVIRGKGVDLLIRALHGLEGDWQFSLAGKGSALGACRELVTQLGLDARVTVHGHLNPRELAAQYREAQIVVVPSAWQEPFGMVGVEAMRHARPVVGFGVGGIPEWLHNGENGLLVPPGDVDALRAALARLLREPETCRAMGLRGLELTSTVFSFARYVDSLEAMLTKLAGAKG